MKGYLLFFLILIPTFLFGQKKEIEVANEYFGRGEYEKSKSYYERLAKNPDNTFFIYKNYLETLAKLNQIHEAEKYLKKLIKNNDYNLEYKIELGRFYISQKQDKDGKKVFQAIVNDVKSNPIEVKKAAKLFIQYNLLDWAEQTYITSRKAIRDEYAYIYEMVELYALLDSTELLVDQVLFFVNKNPNTVEIMKQILQNNISKPEKYAVLEKNLIARIQTETGNIIYNELLIWLYIQQKDFENAFIQAKALDKLTHAEASKLMQVGQISIANKDYLNAVAVFEYITTTYKANAVYPQAQQALINAKEELIKNQYPVVEKDIRSLINEYNKLVQYQNNKQLIAEINHNKALLYAFYLDQKDTAANLLQQILSDGRSDRMFLARVKIDLADVYLLKGEPWEATLLYAQVEKSEKETPIAHEAKLKNAKLSFYKGEFELAQAHLDVLKLATSREIANDAMDLSLLIQDNTVIDTAGEALKEYAKAELLLFQNKDQQALDKLNAILVQFPKHSITSEVYWQEAKVYKKMRQYEKAIEILEKIRTLPDDIFTDDAIYLQALINEENLNNKARAMEHYAELMKKYPASIYVSESRKKYRILRGDFNN